MSEATMRRGSTQRLLVFALCVILFHVSNSIVQEAIFYIPGFHHTVLLTFAQSLCVSLFAAFQLYRSSPIKSYSPWRRIVEARRVPLRTYFMISLMNTTSVYLTNEASRLLSYSTQVVFKSSKLLFVWLVRYIAIELPARFEAKEVSISHETEEVEVLLLQQQQQQQQQQQEKEQQHRTNPTKHDSPEISSGFVTVNVCLPKTISQIPPQCGELSLLGKNSHYNEMKNNVVIGRLSHAAMVHPKIIREASSCVTVVLGLILFTYATTSTRVTKSAGGQQDQSWWPVFTGVSGIVVALVCDAFMYLGEEKYCFMAHNASHDEVQCYVFLLSTLNGLVSLILSGGIGESIIFVQSNPVFFLLLLLSSLCNYGGTFFLLRIISEFNSSTATVVTSVRKVITVLCSYIVYPKPFGVAHFTGVLLVVGGIWQYEEARKMPGSTTHVLGVRDEADK